MLLLFVYCLSSSLLDCSLFVGELDGCWMFGRLGDYLEVVDCYLSLNYNGSVFMLCGVIGFGFCLFVCFAVADCFDCFWGLGCFGLCVYCI